MYVYVYVCAASHHGNCNRQIPFTRTGVGESKEQIRQECLGGVGDAGVVGIEQEGGGGEVPTLDIKDWEGKDVGREEREG